MKYRRCEESVWNCGQRRHLAGVRTSQYGRKHCTYRNTHFGTMRTNAYFRMQRCQLQERVFASDTTPNVTSEQLRRTISLPLVYLSACHACDDGSIAKHCTARAVLCLADPCKTRLRSMKFQTSQDTARNTAQIPLNDFKDCQDEPSPFTTPSNFTNCLSASMDQNRGGLCRPYLSWQDQNIMQ